MHLCCSVIKLFLVSLLWHLTFSVDVFKKPAAYNLRMYKNNKFKLLHNSRGIISWQANPHVGLISTQNIQGGIINKFRTGTPIIEIQQIPGQGFIVLCTKKLLFKLDSYLNVISNLTLTKQAAEVKVIFDGRFNRVSLNFQTYINQYDIHMKSLLTPLSTYSEFRMALNITKMQYSSDYKELFFIQMKDQQNGSIIIINIQNKQLVETVQAKGKTIDIFVYGVEDQQGLPVYKVVRTRDNNDVMVFDYNPRAANQLLIRQRKLFSTQFKISSMKQCKGTEYLILLQYQSRSVHVYTLKGSFLQSITLPYALSYAKEVDCNDEYLIIIDQNGYYFAYAYFSQEVKPSPTPKPQPEPNPEPNPDQEAQPNPNNKTKPIPPIPQPTKEQNKSNQSDNQQNSQSFFKVLEISGTVSLGVIMTLAYLKLRQIKANKKNKEMYNKMNEQIHNPNQINEMLQQYSCKQTENPTKNILPLKIPNSNNCSEIYNPKISQQPVNMKRNSIRAKQEEVFETIKNQNIVNKQPIKYQKQQQKQLADVQNIDILVAKYNEVQMKTINPNPSNQEENIRQSRQKEVQENYWEENKNKNNANHKKEIIKYFDPSDKYFANEVQAERE